MRERHTGRNVPHKQNVMFCGSYLHVCDYRVRLIPSEMEYDIFAHADTESVSVNQWIRHKERDKESDGFFSRLVYLLHSLFSVCVCQTQHCKCHKANPKYVCPAFCKISLLSGEPALRNPEPLSGFLPYVVIVLVFGLITLYGCSFLPFPFPSFSIFYFNLPSPVPRFLNSYLFTVFLQESTFEIHLSVWPSF